MTVWGRMVGTVRACSQDATYADLVSLPALRLSYMTCLCPLPGSKNEEQMTKTGRHNAPPHAAIPKNPPPSSNLPYRFTPGPRGHHICPGFPTLPYMLYEGSFRGGQLTKRLRKSRLFSIGLRKPQMPISPAGVGHSENIMTLSRGRRMRDVYGDFHFRSGG